MCSASRVVWKFRLVGGYFLAVVLTFCSGQIGEQPKEVLIGAYGPLTGSMATQGISTQNGINMAQDKANNAGGVLGRRIHFVMEDDRGTPEEAQTVVTRLNMASPQF